MRLALALYASTAHANTPHCDLGLLYHDGRAHSLGQAPPHLALSVSSLRRRLVEREPEDRGRCAAGESRHAWPGGEQPGVAAAP